MDTTREQRAIGTDPSVSRRARGNRKQRAAAGCVEQKIGAESQEQREEQKVADKRQQKREGAGVAEKL
jgi:hypothetical protein